MKKTISSLIIGCLVLGLVSGCRNGNSGENTIKKLNVDLEKYDLPCESGDVCNEIKNKVVQFLEYKGYVNSVYYDNIILSSDGDIYLYKAAGGKLIKTEGKTELTHIDGTVDSSVYRNELIYGDDKYYSIEKDGTINQVDFGFEFKTLVSYTEEEAVVIDKNDTLVYYGSCGRYKSRVSADVCPSDNSWIKFTADSNSYINTKIKYANDEIFITEDGRMYSNITFFNLDFEKYNYTVTESLKDNVLLNNPIKLWYWGDIHRLFAQTSDNKLYYNYGSISPYGSDPFKAIINLNEKAEKIFGGVYFLIIGENNIYLAIDDGEYYANFKENYNLVELDELKKYKNEIRGLHARSGIIYALLSDGNFYKIYEDLH